MRMSKKVTSDDSALNSDLRIEDIRKCLSTVSTWLTVDQDLRFFKEVRNEISSENSQILAEKLNVCTTRSRKLFNALSESLEDTATHRQSLKSAIERDREMKRKMVNKYGKK